VAMVLGGGTEPERLQVSFYELYYHRVHEIRRQNNHTAQTVDRSKFNENTQNMHAKKSIVYSKSARYHQGLAICMRHELDLGLLGAKMGSDLSSAPLKPPLETW